MPDVTAPEVSRVLKGFIFRAAIWLIVALLIYSVSEWIHTAYWPTETTSVAMDQMKDSDSAFIQMQTHEQVKNSFSTISVLLVVLWTVVVWLDYVVRAYFKVKALAEEEE